MSVRFQEKEYVLLFFVDRIKFKIRRSTGDPVICWPFSLDQLFLLLLVSKLNCCFLRATVNIDDPFKIFEQSKNNANNILVTTLIIEAAYARTIIKSLPH